MARRPPMTEAKKLGRRCQRRADATNERARREIGPLFADQAPVVTAQDAYWQWRRNKACAAEGGIYDPGTRGLEWIEVRALVRLAAGYLDPDDLAELQAYVDRTHKSGPLYHWCFWSEVLTGKRIETRWERNPDPNGRPLVIATRVCPREGWVPPFTREEFYRRFPPDRWNPRRVEADCDPFLTGDDWLDAWHVQREAGVPVRWAALSLGKRKGGRS